MATGTSTEWPSGDDGALAARLTDITRRASLSALDALIRAAPSGGDGCGDAAVAAHQLAEQVAVSAAALMSRLGTR
jgi:hypothetical protein